MGYFGALSPDRCLAASRALARRQAIKRAQQHQLSSASLGGLAGGSGSGASDDPSAHEDAELGVRLHPSFPASLEREGFVSPSGRDSGPYAQLPGSPEFELKAVVGSGGAAAAGSAARDKARLLSSGSGSARLSVTAASGAGGLAGATPAAVRTGSTKAKVSPTASSDRMNDGGPLPRRFSSMDADDGELSARAVARRHPSSSGETLL